MQTDNGPTTTTKSSAGASAVLALLAAGIILIPDGGISALTMLSSTIILTLSAMCLLAGKPVRLSASSLAALILIGLITASVLPLPAGIAALHPGPRHEQNARVTAMLEKAAPLAPDIQVPSAFALTRNTPGTMRTLLLIIMMTSAVWLTGMLEPDEKKRALTILLAAGACIAVAGFLSQHVFPQGRKLWWLTAVPHGSPVGCFINRNHFGGFTALLAPACLAMAAYAGRDRQRLISLAWGTLLLALITITILSLSRGAMLALAAGLGVTTLLLLRKHAVWALIGMPAVILLAAFVAFKFSPESRARAESLLSPAKSESLSLRMATWRDAALILREYPVLGAGAGSFRAVFPEIRTESTRKEPRNAENEFVQIAAEHGLTGALCVLLILAGSISGMRRHWKENNGPDLFLLSAAGALAAALTHACLDFAIRVPLYALVLMVILRLGQTSSESNRIRFPFPLLASAVALILLCSAFRAKQIYSLDSPDAMISADSATLARSLNAAPGYWSAWYFFGASLYDPENPALNSLAAECMSTASEYNPLNYRLWLELARMRLSLGDTAGAKSAYLQAKYLRNLHIYYMFLN
jgi:O-antigen ligase